MGKEHRRKGVVMQLGPVAGPLMRTPEGGRNWEVSLFLLPPWDLETKRDLGLFAGSIFDRYVVLLDQAGVHREA